MKLVQSMGLACCVLGLVAITGCYRPPYNNFQPPYSPLVTHTALGAGGGAVVGALAGAPVLGTSIGAGAGAIVALMGLTHSQLIKTMQRNDIQTIEYGDTITLIIPTDRYYHFNRTSLQEVQYPGLAAMLNFIRLYPRAHFYVTGFTDEVGTKRKNDRFSEARAHTMVAFLYANGVSPRQLDPVGLGPRFPVGDQDLVHGSAYNRRIEIQWSKIQPCRSGCVLKEAAGTYK